MTAATLFAAASRAGDPAAMWRVADQATTAFGASYLRLNQGRVCWLAAMLAAERATPDAKERIRTELEHMKLAKAVEESAGRPRSAIFEHLPMLNPAVFGPIRTFVRPKPATAELTSALKKVRDEFNLASDSASAAQKIDAVHRMVSAAAGETNGAREFALLSLGSDLAVEAGQWEEGIDPVTRIESRFQVEPWRLQTTMLLKAARKGGDETELRRLATRAVWMAEIAAYCNLRNIAEDLLQVESLAVHDMPREVKQPFVDGAAGVRSQLTRRLAADRATPSSTGRRGKSTIKTKPKP
jgi:hypothetical protein